MTKKYLKLFAWLLLLPALALGSYYTVGGSLTFPSISLTGPASGTSLWVAPGILKVGGSTSAPTGADAKVQIVDANVFHVGGGEVAYAMKRDDTVGTRVGPIFSWGRIVSAGTGVNEADFRLCYSDASRSETCLFSWESGTGTYAQIGGGRGPGAALEGYTFDGAEDPTYRLNTYGFDGAGLQFGRNSCMSPVGQMSCAAGTVTVNCQAYDSSGSLVAAEHNLNTGDAVTLSTSGDTGEGNSFKSTSGGATPFTVTVTDADTFTYSITSCSGSSPSVNAHVFSMAPDVHIGRSDNNALSFYTGSSPTARMRLDADSLDLLNTTTNTITSATAAATASSSVASFTFAPTVTLDSNDLVLDIKDTSGGTTIFKVDEDGDTTLGGSISVPNNNIDTGSNSRAALGFFITATATLATCGSGTVGYWQRDATGDTGGKQTKNCHCIKKNDGTTYAWANYANTVASGHRYGNTTTCQDTDE